MKSLYLYALTSDASAEGEALRGIEGEDVRLVAVHGLHAAVGALDAPPAAAAETLLRHDSVVRAIAARAAAVLPMRFGQTVADEGALRAGVERSLPRLRRALQRVEGCEQLDLRLFGERASEGDPANDRARDALAGAGPGARYLAQRWMSARARRLPAQVEPLLRRLQPLVRAELLRTTAEGRLLATLYQLVRRGDRAEYLARIEQGRRELVGLRLAVSGPFPPYAFANGLAGVADGEGEPGSDRAPSA